MNADERIRCLACEGTRRNPNRTLCRYCGGTGWTRPNPLYMSHREGSSLGAVPVQIIDDDDTSPIPLHGKKVS